MIGDNWPNEREFGIWNFFCEDGDVLDLKFITSNFVLFLIVRRNSIDHERLKNSMNEELIKML